MSSRRSRHKHLAKRILMVILHRKYQYAAVEMLEIGLHCATYFAGERMVVLVMTRNTLAVLMILANRWQQRVKKPGTKVSTDMVPHQGKMDQNWQLSCMIASAAAAVCMGTSVPMAEMLKATWRAADRRHPAVNFLVSFVSECSSDKRG
jgi:hypothetical protein